MFVGHKEGRGAKKRPAEGLFCELGEEMNVCVLSIQAGIQFLKQIFLTVYACGSCL